MVLSAEASPVHASDALEAGPPCDTCRGPEEVPAIIVPDPSPTTLLAVRDDAVPFLSGNPALINSVKIRGRGVNSLGIQN